MKIYNVLILFESKLIKTKGRQNDANIPKKDGSVQKERSCFVVHSTGGYQ
ncbi:MAG: hypothetical protein AB7E39_03210 [Endomicrobiaceae bacterium]